MRKQPPSTYTYQASTLMTSTPAASIGKLFNAISYSLLAAIVFAITPFENQAFAQRVLNGPCYGAFCYNEDAWVNITPRPPGNGITNVEMCNEGEIDVDVVFAHQGDGTLDVPNLAQGWWFVERNQCVDIGLAGAQDYSFYIAIVTTVNDVFSSVRLDDANDDIVYNYNWSFFQGDQTDGSEIVNVGGFACADPTPFASAFDTTFNSWAFDAECNSGFVRIPLSNRVTLRAFKPSTAVTLRIRPRLSQVQPVALIQSAEPEGSEPSGPVSRAGDVLRMYPDNGFYMGQIRDNSRNGQGVLYLPNQDQDYCDGEWRDDRLVGVGNGRESGVLKPCYPNGNSFTFVRP